MAAPNPAPPTPEASEPEPGSPAALALLAQLGISPRAAAGAPLAPDDEGFSPIAIGHLNHSLVEVKLLLDQLGAVHKELHETLGLAHLRGDPLHLLPPRQRGRLPTPRRGAAPPPPRSQAMAVRGPTAQPKSWRPGSRPSSSTNSSPATPNPASGQRFGSFASRRGDGRRLKAPAAAGEMASVHSRVFLVDGNGQGCGLSEACLAWMADFENPCSSTLVL